VRDFMPGGISDHRLRLTNKLVSADSRLPDTQVDIVEQFVILRDSVWLAIIDYSSRRYKQQTHQKRSNGGPLWNCQERVIVVARVHDSIAHRDYFLQAKDVIIKCVE